MVRGACCWPESVSRDTHEAFLTNLQPATHRTNAE
jgi:hypothetical protein